MRTILLISLFGILAGCTPKHEALPAASPPPSISATGIWESKGTDNDGTKYRVLYHLSETDGVVTGVVSFPLYTNRGIYRINGIRSGNLLEFFYNVDHYFPIGKFTKQRKFDYRGIISGDTLSGLWIGWEGLGRNIGPVTMQRTSADIGDMPITNETAIVEHEDPMPVDTNMMAFTNELAQLQKDIAAQQAAESNFAKASRALRRTSGPSYAPAQIGMRDGVPISVYNEIAAHAAHLFPGDYHMQEYTIKDDIAAYKRLH